MFLLTFPRPPHRLSLHVRSDPLQPHRSHGAGSGPVPAGPVQGGGSSPCWQPELPPCQEAGRRNHRAEGNQNITLVESCLRDVKGAFRSFYTWSLGHLYSACETVVHCVVPLEELLKNDLGLDLRLKMHRNPSLQTGQKDMVLRCIMGTVGANIFSRLIQSKSQNISASGTWSVPCDSSILLVVWH